MVRDMRQVLEIVQDKKSGEKTIERGIVVALLRLQYRVSTHK
jgi:hypothetical protein